ncbi:hypothetical protein CCAX7_000900 [Capsulimonas corticalis]|uniref:Uncharacterized protein n=1 Tax=Capsulimonas corticalis TaxID=2219043 RepID=A0A402CRB7_9BACT|nr:hypothetical protein [Capsulimonas corticalis]BDI28039.1 hypothetical protein CCAX7_000900 [Capsulimonas corticalis]
MDVYLEGKQKITLTQADFKAQGGEGAVYVKGATAYKVYNSAGSVVPEGKVRALSVLNLPEILRPEAMLTDKNRDPIGYAMRAAPKGYPLCQIFPRAFRDRKGLTPDAALELVRRLQAGVQHVHEQGLLIVDLNEMNFVVDETLDNLYFIDVDSYQAPGFPATALMDSVRDRHARGFSEATDWFAFAVVSFQIFAGIHPYRGKHPQWKTLEERMLRNVSVLNPDVSVPGACLSFDVIPSAYRDWYQSVLDGGQRIAPPQGAYGAISFAPRMAAAPTSASFEIEEMRDYGADIVDFVNGLVITAQGVVIGGATVLGPDVKIGIAPGGTQAVAAWPENGYIRFYDLQRDRPLETRLAGDSVMSSGGRLYFQQGGSLLEVDLVALPLVTLASARPVANVMPQATQLFEGVAVQDVLGACYVSVLPRRGESRQVRLAELDGARIVSASYKDRVLIVIAARDGRYDQYIIRFATDFRRYDLRRREDVASAEINFVVLDSGVCLLLDDHGALEIFARDLDSTQYQRCEETGLDGDCILLKNGTQALFARGAKLFKFGMREEN